MRDSKAHVLPILDDDLRDVADFLHSNMDRRVPVERWMRAMTPAWQHHAPNHGFLLRCNDTVVGAYLALYSEQRSDGTGTSRFCNLAAWCVDPDFRFSSIRLLRALVDQDGYEFTDLSPSGPVVALDERLGFRHLDTTTVMIPCLPYPRIRPPADLTSDPARIRDALAGDDLRVFRDHEASPAVRHVLLETGSGSCHVMFRRDRRRNLPLFASVLHSSDPKILSMHMQSLARHLLVRHRIPLLLCEDRLLAERPSRSFLLRSSRPKMFKGTDVGPEAISNLYSELTELSW